MTKLDSTIKEMLRDRRKRFGKLYSRTWLTERKGVVFTVKVTIGDKLNAPGNKEN